MKNTDILLVTAPFIQYNAAYPATTVLKGFITQHGFSAEQYDLGIETIDLLFSENTLKLVFEIISSSEASLPLPVKQILNKREQYINSITPVKQFLQGNNNACAAAINNGILPKMTFSEYDKTIFKSLNQNEKAKYLATQYITDLGTLITKYIDSSFDFCRYAEHVIQNKATFNEIDTEVNRSTLITNLMWQALEKQISVMCPKIVGISIPFPGNLIPALKMGSQIKTHFPNIKVALGGGFVSCELRSLDEPGIFNYTNYVCLDDGERPLLQICLHVINNEPVDNLVRTFIRVNNKVEFINAAIPDFEQNNNGKPDFSGLPIAKYMSVFTTANPMHRLWNDRFWNKMVLAHGCYWHRCAFCDINLDYIKRYSQASAEIMCNRMESIMVQTGQTGFHFVDEAAPPVLLRNLALEILKRKIKVTWWTNIRFDKLFTSDLCQLLEHSGCIAVSGGLEVASDRLLGKMNKGVSIEQVSQVTHNFQKAGIMVHAYLMYGFPTQTEHELVDSLEVVRQLFKQKLINSGFWHLFVMTAYSHVGQNPEYYSVTRIDPPATALAKNDCEHSGSLVTTYKKFGPGLQKALFNYMNYNCLENSLQDWFDFKIPVTKIPSNKIDVFLKNNFITIPKSTSKIVWLGATPQIETQKNGKIILKFCFKNRTEIIDQLSEKEFEWLKNIMDESSLLNYSHKKLEDWESTYQQYTGQPFELFFTSRNWNKLRKNGLIIL